jgi:hypothetical protein
LARIATPFHERLTDPSSAVPGGFDLAEREPCVRDFDLLQADDVGRCLGQPLQEDRQALGDVVDVEGRELEGHQDPANVRRGDLLEVVAPAVASVRSVARIGPVRKR